MAVRWFLPTGIAQWLITSTFHSLLLPWASPKMLPVQAAYRSGHKDALSGREMRSNMPEGKNVTDTDGLSGGNSVGWLPGGMCYGGQMHGVVLVCC
mmetsp:Transcript_27237/g.55606  ORF Transcript_27237/g.55606 Transcript_27237/m.55606 type:complete len:96 (-) Transcript_27237:506-793(-)